MHATTGLAVSGASWGAFAAADPPAGAKRKRACTRMHVSLGPAGTRYEVLQMQALHGTIEFVMGSAATVVDGIAGSSAVPRDVAEVTGVLEEVSIFYRRARGSRDGTRLMSRGYSCKHFARLFLRVFLQIEPGVCDRAPYKVFDPYIPDENKHMLTALAELSCAELATLFDVDFPELPMWACLAGKAEELLSKLLVDGDVSRVVAWQRDREPIDCDGEEWPMTVPDTLDAWLRL
jgi:hypothetical protein